MPTPATRWLTLMILTRKGHDDTTLYNSVLPSLHGIMFSTVPSGWYGSCVTHTSARGLTVGPPSPTHSIREGTSSFLLCRVWVLHDPKLHNTVKFIQMQEPKLDFQEKVADYHKNRQLFDTKMQYVRFVLFILNLFKCMRSCCTFTL